MDKKALAWSMFFANVAAMLLHPGNGVRYAAEQVVPLAAKWADKMLDAYIERHGGE